MLYLDNLHKGPLVLRLLILVVHHFLNDSQNFIFVEFNEVVLKSVQFLGHFFVESISFYLLRLIGFSLLLNFIA